MADAATILNDPAFINANEATKKAIFDKHVAKDPGYLNATPDTQTAIRQRFGLEFPPGPGQAEAGGTKFTFPDAQSAAGFERGMRGSAVPADQMAMQYGGKPEPIPAARKPAPPTGFFTGMGRSAAGLADTTLGSVGPAVVQQFGYPVARMFQSPEAASATVGKLSAPLEKPFGRAFGVTETPEYKGEASQRLTQFVGENIDKGAKWLSQQTGLPEQDITNMMGTLSMPAAGKLSKPVNRAVSEATTKVGVALGERAADKAIAASNKSWEDAPRIDATKAAQKHGILVNPAQTNPGKVNTAVGALAGGPNVNEALAKTNAPRWTTLAKEDMGMPKNTVLEPAAFKQARANLAEPYNRMQAVGTMLLDDEFQAALNNVNSPQILGGIRSPVVDRMLADASQVTQINGRDALATIQAQRQIAQKIYDRDNGPNPPSVEDRAVAEAAMQIANAVEDLVVRNIPDPRYRAELSDARARMATTYAYERATDGNTKKVDPNIIAKLVAKDPDRYTGTIKDIGQIAGNFPDIASIKDSKVGVAPRLLRSTPSVLLGTGIGTALGASPLAGAAVGAVAGAAGSNLLRRGISRPGYQNFMGMPADNRLRVDMPEQAPPAVTNNLPVVFDPRNAVMGPETGRPNWVYGQNDFGGVPPDPRFSPPAGPPQLTYDLTGLTSQQRRVYERARDENAERVNSLNPTWGPYSPPTTGGVPLQLDPFINKLRPVEPTGAALPVQSELSSAVGKIERGERATLTATEKIAFDKAQANLLIADPAYKSLTPDEIVNRMSDRKSVEATVKKAREKAAGFDEIARRAKDQQAVSLAHQNRERMLDFAEELEDRLRAMPTVKYGQGPKTRAAQTLPITDKRLP